LDTVAEDELIWGMRANFLDKGLYFCDEDFRLEAFRFYEEIRHDHDHFSHPDTSRIWRSMARASP
jgi:hypothetical protein